MKKHLYEPPVTKEVALFSAQQPICASDVRTDGQDVHDHIIGEEDDDWD